MNTARSRHSEKLHFYCVELWKNDKNENSSPHNARHVTDIFHKACSLILQCNIEKFITYSAEFIATEV